MPRSIDDSSIQIGNLVVLKDKTPSPVLMFNGTKLGNKDYKTVWDKESETLAITGKGNFTDETTPIVSVVESKNEIKKFKVTIKLNGKKYYNGEEQLLSDEELSVTDSGTGETLSEGSDYFVSYSGAVNAGTVKVMVTGTGDYTGSINKSFKIEAYKAGQNEIAVTLDEVAKAGLPYVKTGTTLGNMLSVSISGTELVENKDYKVTYGKNKAVNSRAEYTVKFIGNYKGSPKQKGYFTIVQAPITDAHVYMADKIFKKAGVYKSTPYVNLQGIQLTKKDFSVKYYFDEEHTKEVTKNSKITTPGSVIYATITGKGNYTGYAYATYTVADASGKINISKCKIKVGKQVYSGKALTPAVTVECKVNGVNKVLEAEKDYTVFYSNNVNKGKAVIIINGIGDYAGSKIGKFSIVAKKIK